MDYEDRAYIVRFEAKGLNDQLSAYMHVDPFACKLMIIRSYNETWHKTPEVEKCFHETHRQNHW